MTHHSYKTPMASMPLAHFGRFGGLAPLRMLILALTLWAPPLAAFAEAGYPARPVRFVNAFPPGGPADLLARSVAEVLQGELKQAFVVENKPGAGGNLGAGAVAKGPADGYAVLFGIDTTFTVNPHIYGSMPFRPGELRPLMILASSGLLVGTSPSSGIATLPDLVAQARARRLNFGSGGSGSPGHLAIEEFQHATGLKLNHVPYKGSAPAVTAVVGSEVDGGFLATPSMLPFVRAGKVTALAVTSRQRSRLLPGIATVAELGMKALQHEVLYVAMVPAGTPEPVVRVLERAIADALARPAVQARMQALDLQPEGITGAAAAQRLSALSERYRQLIVATGMRVE